MTLSRNTGAGIVKSDSIQRSGKNGWKQSKWLIPAELLVVALIFVADARGHIVFSKTPYLLAFAWISLRVRGIRWRDIGFTRYRTWTRTLLLGASAGLAMEAVELFVTQPFLVHVLHKQPDLELFHSIHGNLKATLIYMALVWPFAAFGEEMVYRGYLMNRVADLFNRSRRAWIVSLLAVHVGFGLAHGYQGITGVIDEGLMGLLLGVIYLRTGQNLSVGIVAHGIADTVDFLLIFLGKYPGLS